MRLKLYIPSIFKKINIQNIEPIYDSQPRVLFTCDKKYECAISNSEVIFVDLRGTEMFRARRARLHCRLYEIDPSSRKIIFELRDLEFQNYGLISSEFLKKQLKNVSNLKAIPPQEIHHLNSERFLRPSWWFKRPAADLRNGIAVFSHRKRPKICRIFYEFFSKNLNIPDKYILNFPTIIFKIEQKSPT